jgi:hypothetical protein
MEQRRGALLMLRDRAPVELLHHEQAIDGNLVIAAGQLRGIERAMRQQLARRGFGPSRYELECSTDRETGLTRFVAIAVDDSRRPQTFDNRGIV